MADKDDLLFNKTGKGQYNDETQRIYEAIRSKRLKKSEVDLTEHKIVYVLAALISQLIEQNLITQQELDEILLQACT